MGYTARLLSPAISMAGDVVSHVQPDLQSWTSAWVHVHLWGVIKY
jgi:hypothetical protein